jgi:hypothetical protein
MSNILRNIYTIFREIIHKPEPIKVLENSDTRDSNEQRIKKINDIASISVYSTPSSIENISEYRDGKFYLISDKGLDKLGWAVDVDGISLIKKELYGLRRQIETSDIEDKKELFKRFFILQESHMQLAGEYLDFKRQLKKI